MSDSFCFFMFPVDLRFSSFLEFKSCLKVSIERVTPFDFFMFPVRSLRFASVLENFMY